MGANAVLYAIGPYTPEHANAYEYPASYYEDIPVGKKIVTAIVIAETTSESERLAEALGVGLYNLGEHFLLDQSKFSQNALQEDFESQYQDFKLLFYSGKYDFFLMPNF